MKKKKVDRWNLVFSAFLVTAFLVCASFFIGMINDSYAQEPVKHTLFVALVFVLFGLLLFYATRVGDGKQVVRFSPVALILMVLPALYVIIASAVSGLPFHDVISQRSELVNIAAVILGYGIPYTFLSGFELAPADKPSPTAEALSTEEPQDNAVSDTTDEDINAIPSDPFSDEPSDEES